MRFIETHKGESHILVGALEATARDGYIAASVVNGARCVPDARHAQAFRIDSLARGYRWASAEKALRYALNRGREMIHSRSLMLSC